MWFCPAVFAVVLTVGHGTEYQYQTITAAMAVAEDGDQIVVADGTYNMTNPQFPETFPIDMKPGITLQRASEEYMPVIDAEQSGSVLDCNDLIPGNMCLIDGFRITGAGGAGHGISINNAVVTIRSCYVTDNISSTNGAGISIWDSDVLLENCMIYNNSSTGPNSSGGGINVFGADSVTIEGCDISSNIAAYSGGGMRVYDSSIAISDSSIRWNVVQGPGGGLFFDWCSNDRSIRMEKTIIEANDAGTVGGGIAFTEMPINPWISYCEISSNRATGNGAGFHVSGVDPRIVFTSFLFNNSQNSGGGLFSESAYVQMICCIVADNIASNGGGLYMTDGSQVLLWNALMDDNQAGESGGAIYGDQSALQLYHCTLEGNMSPESAGTLRVNSVELIVQSSILWNNAEPVIVDESSAVQIDYSNIQGNYPGTANSGDDPLFITSIVTGEDHFLSHTASGQAQDSPCIDTGKFASNNTGYDLGDVIIRLSDMSTRTDRMIDTGISDRGFHYFRNPDDCHKTGCEIIMPSSEFGSGDECYCDVIICNSEQEIVQDVPVFVLLDIAGTLFCAPEFNDFSYYPMTIYPGVQFIHVIPRFAWPENAGTFNGAYWYAAMTDPDITELFGSLGTFEFGWH